MTRDVESIAESGRFFPNQGEVGGCRMACTSRTNLRTHRNAPRVTGPSEMCPVRLGSLERIRCKNAARLNSARASEEFDYPKNLSEVGSARDVLTLSDGNRPTRRVNARVGYRLYR